MDSGKKFNESDKHLSRTEEGKETETGTSLIVVVTRPVMTIETCTGE